MAHNVKCVKVMRGNVSYRAAKCKDFQSSPFSKEGIIEGNFQYLDGGLRIRVELCINIDSDDHIMIMERRVLSYAKQTLKCLKALGLAP